MAPVGDRWVIRKEGASRASGVFATQDEAASSAREELRAKGGTLLIHGRDGRIRQSFTLGRAGLETISAVEGIRLTGEMRRDFREFDHKNLSAEERRKAILDKYGKASAKKA